MPIVGFTCVKAGVRTY